MNTELQRLIEEVEAAQNALVRYMLQHRRMDAPESDALARLLDDAGRANRSLWFRRTRILAINDDGSITEHLRLLSQHADIALAGYIVAHKAELVQKSETP